MDYFDYLVNGVILRANHPLEDLKPFKTDSTPDVLVWLGTLEAFRERHPDLEWDKLLKNPFTTPIYAWWHLKTKQGEQILFQSGDQNHLMVSILSCQGERIEIGWCGPANVSEQDLVRLATTIQLPRLIGFALRLSGRIVLHGNAVNVGDRSIAWVGTPGVGKSTLSAAFLDAGHGLLSDDQVVIHHPEGVPAVTPGILRLRLWPKSLPTITNTSERHHFQQPFGSHIKGYLNLNETNGNFNTLTSFPLCAIYVLEPRQRNLKALKCETIPASKSLYLLLQHCMGRHSLPFNESQKRKEFNNMGNLVRRVPVCSLQLPDDLTSLKGVVRDLAARCDNAEF